MVRSIARTSGSSEGVVEGLVFQREALAVLPARLDIVDPQ